MTVETHLFSRLPNDNDNDVFTNHFSVPSPNQTSLRSRAIVTHIGEDSGSGEWKCSKDSASNCTHITIARHFLQKVVQANPAAEDESVDVNAPLDYKGEVHSSIAMNSLRM